MADIEDGSNEGHQLLKLKQLHFWLQLALNVVFLVVGQAAAIILGRIYYEKGGNSKWLATLVQTAGFPILLIPYYFLIPPPKQQSDSSNQNKLLPPPSIIKATDIYLLLGALIAGDNMLYSTALLYLSASTFSLICATQLAFNAIFSFFINGKKFTALIFNSVISLSLAAVLLAINKDSDKPSGITMWKYIIGIIAATVASALYSLILPLMQHSFQKVIKKETFSVVLEMQIYTSLIATGISTIGLFSSGEWTTVSGEMHTFTTGKAAYVQVLVWTAVGWQIAAVGVVGLIFVVSSLFSNVISTLSLVVTPIASMIILHDKMNAVKMIALLMAMWGFGSCIYQNYLDDLKVRQASPTANYKLTILGDESVGKSSIITRFMYNKFNNEYEPTFGIDFLSKTVYLEDRTIRLQFWDSAGQKTFGSLMPSYIRDSAIAAIVYSVTSRKSFLYTSELIEKVRADRGSDVIIVLVGNKTDLVEKRKVSKEEGEAKARELNVMFIETSAKAGLNIKPLFRKIGAALPKGRHYHSESYKWYCQIVLPHFYSMMRQIKNMIFCVHQ